MSKNKIEWFIYEVRDWGGIPNNEDICNSLNKELPKWLEPEDYDIANEVYGLDEDELNYDRSYVGDKEAWLFGKVVMNYKPDRTWFGTYEAIMKHLAYCERKNSRNSHYRFFAHKNPGEDATWIENKMRTWFDEVVENLALYRNVAVA